MIENVSFSLRGLSEYIYWQTEDRRTLNKINKLMDDIIRNGCDGLGNPEPLKGDNAGKWSRKIDEKNRLVYEIIDGNRVEICQCKGHYDDK